MDYNAALTLCKLYNSFLCASQNLQRAQVPPDRQGFQGNFWYVHENQSNFQAIDYQYGAQYQYDNFEAQGVANRLHPEPPAFRPRIDYPPTENMYSKERGNRHPYLNRRGVKPHRRRRSHLDDIYFPNHEEDKYSDNRNGFSEKKPYRRCDNYPSRGIPTLKNVKIFPKKKIKTPNCTLISKDNKSNDASGAEDGDEPENKLKNNRLFGKSSSVKNNTNSQSDSTGRSQKNVENIKQSVDAKSLPVATKNSDIDSTAKKIETSSKYSEAPNLVSDNKNSKAKTEPKLDLRESNVVDTEISIPEPTTSDSIIDNASSDCSQDTVCLADIDTNKTYLSSSVFVDSKVLELNIDSPISETTESPKKRKIETINFKQILNDLSGILHEDEQLKSDKNQIEIPENSKNLTAETNNMSGDDLLALLESSPSCSSRSSVNGVTGVESSPNDCRRIYSESSANCAKLTKPPQKDKVTKIDKPENKANDKPHPYFPTLSNYNIPKRIPSRKNEFSDTNELYLHRMKTLFGSDNSDESQDEDTSKTPKTKSRMSKSNIKIVNSKVQISKSSADKHKSLDQKKKVEDKELKLSNIELNKKRRISVVLLPKLQESESKANKIKINAILDSFQKPSKLVDKESTMNDINRKVPAKANEDNGRKNIVKVTKVQDKIVQKRSDIPDPVSNKRRRISAESSQIYPFNEEMSVKTTESKKIKTKLPTRVANTHQTIVKKINNITADQNKYTHQCNNSKTAQSDKNKSNNSSVKVTINKESKPTSTEITEPSSREDDSNVSITKANKDLTHLIKNSVVSSENVLYFHCSPMSPFQLPLKQTISQCSIAIKDCCDEVVVLERPEIKEIIQIVVNKSIKHVSDEVIEIKPEVAIIDLTDDGDDNVVPPQNNPECEPLPNNSEELQPPNNSKQELLDMLKEGTDKSITPGEQITLYRSDETLNNLLEIQATAASISLAALLSSEKVKRNGAEVKRRKSLKVEDDSGIDTNESEEESSKIASEATDDTSNDSQRTGIAVSRGPGAAADKDGIGTLTNVFPLNTSVTDVPPSADTNPVCRLNVDVVVDEAVKKARENIRLVEENRLPSNTNTIPTIQPPVLQTVGLTPQRHEAVSCCDCSVQDTPSNRLQGVPELPPPPPYPGPMLRNVHVSPGNTAENPTTNNLSDQQTPYNMAAQSPNHIEDNPRCNLLPVHNTLEVYKKDYNNLGTLLVDYLIFLLNMRKAQATYVDVLKKLCQQSSFLLVAELQRFQTYYRDNMTGLGKNLRMDLDALKLTSFMRMNNVPHFLKAIEIALFKKSSSASKTSVTFWLYSLMAEDKEFYAWHGSLCCLFRYLAAALQKLEFKNKSNTAINADVLSSQQRNMLQNQIAEYNKICAKSMLSATHRQNTGDRIDLAGNISSEVSTTARTSSSDEIGNNLQRIRLPRSLPYDVHVSVASVSTPAPPAITSNRNSIMTPSRTPVHTSSGYPTAAQSNNLAGVANSPAHRRMSNNSSNLRQILTSPRAERSPAHTAATSSYSIQLNSTKTNNQFSSPPMQTAAHISRTPNVSAPSISIMYSPRHLTAVPTLPAHTMSAANSPAHQSVHFSPLAPTSSTYNSLKPVSNYSAHTPAVQNSPAHTYSILNSPAQTAVEQHTPAQTAVEQHTPAHISAVQNSPAHTSSVLNSPARTSSIFNSPRAVALNVHLSDSSHVFKPPQIHLKLRNPSNRSSNSKENPPQQTPPVSMSPLHISGQSPARGRLLKDLLTPSPARTCLSQRSTVESAELSLRNLLNDTGSSSGSLGINLFGTPTTSDAATRVEIPEKSPVYAPMLFSPSSYQIDEDDSEGIETIDLTWVDDVDEEQLQMEIDYLVKKEEPADEDQVILNQEQFPVTPSTTDGGIASSNVQTEVNELYTDRTCICAKRAEYICGCRMAMYCSLPCQKKDWTSHKAICLKYTAKNKESPSSGQQQ